MVFNALQEVAHQFGVEKLHRQFHQLDEEVGDERDVDARGYVQNYFRADKIDGSATEQQHHFCQQHEPNKADVFSTDTRIDDGLGEKGEH